jgi:hypothetical protein
LDFKIFLKTLNIPLWNYIVNEPWKVAVDDGLYANLSLCYGIGAHINDLIVKKKDL